MTLESFMNLPFMQEITLLYPVAGTEQLEINNITVLEAPVENFAREKEVVLSTGLTVRNSKDTLRSFIREIYELNAVALILSFPKDDYTVLYEVKEEFQKLNFPIFMSPWEMYFSDILEHTYRAIWVQDTKGQSGAEALQKQLLHCYLEDGTYRNAVEILGSFFGCECLLLDFDGRIKGANIELSQETLEQYLKEHEEELLESGIENSERIYGRLVLVKTEEKFSKAEMQNLLREYCNTVLVLWFSREWAITALRMKSHEEFVYKIASGSFLDVKELYYQAEFLGFPTNCEYLCFVGTAFYRTHLKQEKYTTPFFPDTQASSTMMQLEMIEAAQEMGRKAMVTYHNQKLIVFLEWNREEEVHGFIRRFLDLADGRLEKSFPRLAFAWGYDSQGAAMELLHKRYQNAGEALDICRELVPDICRKCYQFSMVTKMLTLLEGDGEMLRMVQDKLEPLLEYDRVKHTNLLETLDCYFDTNYNISETARLQHLHRQSLLYRLEKIEELCSLSLKNHEELYLLETCIKVYKNMHML